VEDRFPRRLVWLFVLVVLVDQATKLIAQSALTPGVPIPVIGDYLRWTLTLNPGGAFGTRIGTSNYYLISSIIIFFVLIFYVWRNRRTLHIAVPLSIVSGGAIGNIIDRLRFGEVVDFIDCDIPDIVIGSYHLERWPIFNVADMAVSCGILVTIFLVFFHSRKPRPAPIETPPQEVDQNPSGF
jgi:signal peptidase II